MNMPSQNTRAYIYRVLTAGAPIAATYGAMSDTQAVLWLALAATILGTGLAAANTETEKPRDEGGAVSIATICLVIIATVLALSWLGVHGHVG